VNFSVIVLELKIPTDLKYLFTFGLYHLQCSKIYLRNKSWKPECVERFNMYWRILVFYPELEARDTIY